MDLPLSQHGRFPDPLKHCSMEYNMNLSENNYIIRYPILSNGLLWIKTQCSTSFDVYFFGANPPCLFQANPQILVSYSKPTKAEKPGNVY